MLVGRPISTVLEPNEGARIERVEEDRVEGATKVGIGEGLKSERSVFAERDFSERGYVIELSGGPGSARTSAAVSFVVKSQHRAEPTAWVQRRGGGLFPPDLSDAGVDLASLVVVHIPDTNPHSSRARAAEILLRSGGFGLVVVDFTDRAPRGGGWLERLAAQARQHTSLLVLLTGASANQSSAGPLVTLRTEPQRVRCGPGRFLLRSDVLRDKRPQGDAHRSEHCSRVEARRGPWGLA